MNKRHLRKTAVEFAIEAEQQIQLMSTCFAAIRKLAEEDSEIKALAVLGLTAAQGLENDIDVFGAQAAGGDDGEWREYHGRAPAEVLHG